MYIKLHFNCIATAITGLERNDVPLVTNVSLIENLLLDLKSAPGEIAKTVVKKFDYVLQKKI